MTKLQSIQILRAVAALSVIIVHCALSWHDDAKGAEVFRLGGYGVDVFFVISGYIICSVARASPSSADFLRKRFIRVAPVYYVYSAPHYLIMFLTFGSVPLTSLATTLLFWPAWGMRPTFPLLTVGWSLGFEVLFYTGFAAAMRFGRRGAAAILTAYAGAAALNMAGAGGVFLFLGSPLLTEFLLGVLIAMAPGRRSPASGAAAVALACAGFALHAALGLGDTWRGGTVLTFRPDVALARLVWSGPAAALLVWGALQLEPWCRGRAAAVLSYFGDASFSIYLAHPLVILFTSAAWRAQAAPPIALPFVDLYCGVTAGVLAFEFVEKPLLAFLHRQIGVGRDGRPARAGVG
jgi:exopolysaccharide production protein ExoZ